MNSLTKISLGIIIILALSVVSSRSIFAQDSEQNVLESGTLQEQFEHVHSRTRIYEGFRAIRDDMFQKVRRNSLDSLNQAKQQIQSYINQLEQANVNMEVLQARLDATIIERDKAIGEKDSIFLLGIPLNKTFYNVLLWSIIGGLIVFTGIAFVLFQRSNKITRQTNREMADLQEEYDEYRKSSRERFEKQSIEHFNELRRLKGI